MTSTTKTLLLIMKTKLSVFLLAVALGIGAQAQQTNIIYGYSSDVGLAPDSTNVTATATLLFPNPRTVNNFTVRQDPVVRRCQTNGYYAFTNLQWGRYNLQLSGRGTTFQFTVGTNTSGTVAISTLVGAATQLPPNPATNYYNQAQVDALMEALTNGLSGGSGAPLRGGVAATVTESGGTNIVDVDTNIVATVASLTTVSNQLGQYSKQWDTAIGRGIKFAPSSSNMVAQNSGTNSILAHGTQLLNLLGTNYMFVVGRGGTLLRRYQCDNLSETADCTFTNDLKHGGQYAYGADTLLYANGQLLVVWNDASPGTTNLTVSAVNPLTMAWSDVIHTNGLTPSGASAFSTFNTVGACVTSNQLFVAGSGVIGATFFVYSLTNWALLYSTNFVSPPPVGYPGYFHAMHYDGRYVWGAGYSTMPGVVRIDPSDYTLNTVSITNSGDVYGVPLNNGSTAGIYRPTDDICSFGNSIYIPTEDTNGVITVINRDSLVVSRIRTGASGICWGGFAIGDLCYFLFPSSYIPEDATNGTIVRLDPSTLQVTHHRAPYAVNEIHSDGSAFYVTTYSGDTNESLVAKIGALEFLAGDYFLASTNGSLRFSLDRSGKINADPNVVSSIYGSARFMSNINVPAPAWVGGFEYILDTNNLQTFGAGTAFSNGKYTFVGGSYSNSATRFWTNVGTASGIPIWHNIIGGNIRYAVTNSTLAATNIAIGTGTSPAPTNVFHVRGIYRGTPIFTNTFVAQSGTIGGVQFDNSTAAGIFNGTLYGNGSGITNITADNITSGTLDVARYAVTNGVVATNQSYALVMHGTNPPAFVSTLTNLTLVSPTNTSVYIVPGGSISFGAYIDSTISSNATGVLVLGNGRLYIDTSGHIRKASGRNFYWGGAGSLPYDVDSSATVITYGSRHVTNSLSAGNTITATNGFVSPPLVCATDTTNWSGQSFIITTTNTTVFMSVTGQEGKRVVVSRSPLNTAAGGQATLYCTNGSFWSAGAGTFVTNLVVPISAVTAMDCYGTNFILR